MRRPLLSTICLCVGTSAVFGACASSGQGSLDRNRPSPQRTVQLDATGDVLLRTTEELTVRVDTVALAAEEAWAHLPAVFDALEIPITEVNADARLLGGTNVRVRGRIAGERLSRVFNCGAGNTGRVADQAYVYFTALTQVEPLDGRSVVTTHVRAHALPGGYTSNAIRCSSRGELEKRIRNRLVWETTGVGDEPG